MLQKALGRSTNPDIEALSQQQRYDLYTVRVDEGWIEDVSSLLSQMRDVICAVPRTVTLTSIAQAAKCNRKTISKIFHFSGNANSCKVQLQVFLDIAEALGKKVMLIWCDKTYDLQKYRDQLRDIPIFKNKMNYKNLFQSGGNLAIDGFVFNLAYKNQNNIMLANMVHLVYQLNGQVVLA